tara:strand:- start:193 stop:369 length:177 start_codon:yes stop_codon:yes gene_type:complete
MSSKPIENGLRELNIDKSLLVIISSFVKQVYLVSPIRRLTIIIWVLFLFFQDEKLYFF